MAIYAGADLFLMPSKSEPCGLSQMIAMRYGTVPIVRETGGLKDTVQPYESWRDAGNGFTFANYASGDMLYVIREAVYLYKDYPDAFGRLRQRAMLCDFSWNRSAQEYLRIYAGITGRTWTPPEPAPEEAPEAEEAPAEAAAEPAETPATEAPAEAAAEPAETPVTEAPAETAVEPAEAPATEAPTEAAEASAEAPAPAAKKAPAKKAAPARKPARRAAAKKETKKKGTAGKG